MGAVPQQHQPPVSLSVPKRKHRKWPWMVGVVVLLLVIVAMSGNDGGSGSSTNSRSASGAAPAVQPVLGPAKAITERDWQLIAKDPEAHTGDRVIVYGEVTQFDATTGTDAFRANVDGVEHKPEYGYADYETNTILNGDDAALKALVQGDLFKAEVTVAGAQSYENTMGGTLTAPKLTVTKVDVIGHL
jgi:hypothetical protein